MGGLQPVHWIIVLVIVVLLFGGSKIPELMRGVGKGMGEFKKGVEEGKRAMDDNDDDAAKLREKQAALEAQKKQIEEQEAELKKLQEKQAGKS